MKTIRQRIVMLCLCALSALWLGPSQVNAAEQRSPAAGLIGCWRFDEGTGTVARDSSGHGADCALRDITNDPYSEQNSWEWVEGTNGHALQFNWPDSYLEAADSAKLNLTGGFTIEFWMKPADWAENPSEGVVSKKRTDGAPGYVIYCNGGRPTKITLRAHGTDGATDFSSTSDVDEDVWQHWTVTYDPASKTVVWYKNGKPDNARTGVFFGDMSTDEPFQIGHAQTWNGYFVGALDDLKIYRRALSGEEVRAEYEATAGKNAHGNTAAPEVNPSTVPAPPVHWRVVRTKFPTMNAVVAGCTVQDCGARGDGRTDDTAAFQVAINALAKAGGGTVFVPAGRYAIKGHLNIPTGVTLRGDWEKPAPGQPVRGTILMAYAGRGSNIGVPFLRLQACSGVRDLAIWYPEQDPAHIVPYPFCVKTRVSMATVENVTLVNPYQGIEVGPLPNGTQYLRNVYGTPLATGIQVDNNRGGGYHHDIYFGPDLWSDSRLPGAPVKNGPHALWMMQHGTAIRMARIDLGCFMFSSVSGYKNGIELFPSKNGTGTKYGAFYGQCYKVNVTNCVNALIALQVHQVGASFTACEFAGDENGVLTGGEFASRMIFNSCEFRGKQSAVHFEGTAMATALFQRCRFDGSVTQEDGNLSLLDSAFSTKTASLTLCENVRAATVAGCTFNGASRIVNQSPSKNVRIIREPVTLPQLPKTPDIATKPHRPAKDDLYIVTDAKWGAKNDGITDDTAAIQKALDAAAKNGGGIVFLPGGEYDVRGQLTIPSGVELRGVYDVPHASHGKGSALRLYVGRNDESGAPAIVMEKRSGLRGLTFLYLEQRYDAIVPYSYMIQGRGGGIYAVDLSSVNPYKLFDGMTYRCDDHYLESVYGAALKIGFAIGGGSTGGEIRDCTPFCQEWTMCPYPDCPGVPDRRNALSGDNAKNPVLKYMMQNLDAFVFGDCRDELGYYICECGVGRGLHFISQNGKGASGLMLGYACEAARISAQFDGLGSAGMDFINSELTSYAGSDGRYVLCNKGFRGQARFFNTRMWGAPTFSTEVQGGSLALDGASFLDYAPLLINGGNLKLSNAFFHRARPAAVRQELDIRDGGTVTLAGNITPHGLRVDADTPAGSVASVAETHIAPPRDAAKTGPIAWWTFDDGRGDVAKDCSGHGHDGTVHNGTWTTGKTSGALSFNGDGMVTVDAKGFPAFKAFSIEAWICPQELTFAKMVSWDGRFQLRIDPPNEQNHFSCFAFLDGGWEPRAAGIPATAGTWQHVVAVWDGTYLQLWVNGKLQAEVPRFGAFGPADGPLLLGQGLKGKLGAVKIYDRALTEEELVQAG